MSAARVRPAVCDIAHRYWTCALAEQSHTASPGHMRTAKHARPSAPCFAVVAPFGPSSPHLPNPKPDDAAVRGPSDTVTVQT